MLEKLIFLEPVENNQTVKTNNADAFEEIKPISTGEVLKNNNKEQLMKGVWEEYPMGLELYRTITEGNIIDMNPNDPFGKKGA